MPEKKVDNKVKVEEVVINYGNAFHLEPYKKKKVTKKERPLIISRELIEVYKPQNDGVVKTFEFVETGRLDLKDYVQSFKDEVGIENIFRKVEMTGDGSLLNQTHRVAAPIMDDGKEAIQDYVDLPDNVEDAAKLVAEGRALFRTLPSDLTGNKSFVEFVESCTDEQVKAYLKQVIAQNQPKKEENVNE